MQNHDDWYQCFHFYGISFLDGSYEIWTTKLSYAEAKNKIDKEPFIIPNESISNKDQYEISTKVIKSIRDITEWERNIRRERDENNKVRTEIVQEIRNINLPKFYKWIYGLNKPPLKDTSEFQKQCGMDKDYLMKYNQHYLKKLLTKCKKKSFK